MWKTLWGHCIYQSSEKIRVFQNPFFRWLQFDSRALQTVLNRYFPHKPGLNYIKLLVLPVQLQPQNCCMLGLGGGGAAHALAPYLRDYQLTVVENNAEVIDIAKRFFMINKLANLQIIHQDAQEFVHECISQYQYVLVDLFTADIFPTACNSEEFFANCKRLLQPKGVLAVNLANRHEQWPILQLLKKQFLHSTIVLPVRGSVNIIVLAINNKSITPLVDLLQESKKLKRLAWDAKWGPIAEVRNVQEI
jgi:spermidine synthase